MALKHNSKMYKKGTLFCVLLISAFVSNAQMIWQNVDSLFAPLPPYLHVYKTTSPLDGKPNIAYYVSVPIKNKSTHITTQVGNGKRYTPTQYYTQEAQPLVVVNATFFTFADNRNLNLVMRNKKQMAYNLPSVKAGKDSTQFYYITRSALGISKNGKADVAWIYSDSSKRWPMAFQGKPSTVKGPLSNPALADIENEMVGERAKKWKMQTAIGGGPMLLQNGEPAIYNVAERMFVNGENDRHPRTAMGYTADGTLIILAVEGRNPGVAEGATLLQEAQLLAALQCREALNLDGGGSSCMLINGKETIKPSDKEGQRAIPAVLLIYKQD